MDRMPSLRTALLDLLYEMRSDDPKLIIGGGYGIYLKREYVRPHGIRTLFREWPEARSTNDIDLFLRPELLIDSRRLRPLAIALRRLGYAVVPGAEKYQFVRQGPSGGREGSVKIDLLTGPQDRFSGTPAHVDRRRVRPRPSVDLHAHPVDEALTLEDDLLPLTLAGTISNGSTFQAEVYLPHPLTFTLMKLFAFRDRAGDQDKEFGRYHALDIYAVLATTSEREWERALALCEIHREEPILAEAGRIVERCFSSLTSEGVVRMRENPYCRPELHLEDFCKALQELFPFRPQPEGR